MSGGDGGTIYTLFANTGTQFINTGIQADTPETWTSPTDQNGEPIQWLLCRAVKGYRIIAVDTQTGPRKHGFLADDENTIDDPAIRFSVIGDEQVEPVTIRVLPGHGGAGDPIDVAFVLDFGNCRTVGLLVELTPGSRTLKEAVLPFRLYDHRKLGLDETETDDERFLAEVRDAMPFEEVFDSKFDLVRDQIPVRTIVELEKRTVTQTVSAEGKRRWPFGGHGAPSPASEVKTTIEVPVKRLSPLFPDLSVLRMGSEADDFRVRVKPEDGILTGMSSPKRYLWASRPRTQNFWHHITSAEGPAGKCFETLRGRLLAYIYEDDADWGDQLPRYDEAHKPPTRPNNPKYPARTMMVFVLHELFCQAFSEVNSIAYRCRTATRLVKRRLSHIVMSFPSGMSEEEVQRYRTQAEKALGIFADSCLRQQGEVPELHMHTDEGTASQLAYIYSEILACGSGRSWLELAGRPHPAVERGMVARIASLDIGGGTTDLMIADYTDQSPGPGTNLLCEIKYLDGITKAGDDLIKGVLEQIILPQVANSLSIGKQQLRSVFEFVGNGALNAAKRRWVSQVWVPAARAYLAMAEAENERGTFQLGQVCSDTTALMSMRQALSRAGREVSDPADVKLCFEREKFDRVLMMSLGNMLFRFASVVASLDCDVLLLAGRPTRLPALQRLLRWYLPLPPSRIVPLDRFPAGPWYPFQSPAEPGLISDPKTAVVVGSAVEFLCSSKQGLGNIGIRIVRTEESHHSFYWGIAEENRRWFSNEQALFGPDPKRAGGDSKTFELIGPEVIIARRLSDDEQTEVSAVYSISVIRDKAYGPIQITLKRLRTPSGDERLELVSVRGMVGENRRAVLGRDVVMELRTLFEDRYFLDTEVFHNIDYDAVNL